MSQTINIRRAVEFAVNIEELGSIFYEEMARKFEQDDEISAIFSTLASDEVAHHHQFEALLAQVPDEITDYSMETTDPNDERDPYRLGKAMFKSAFFADKAKLYDAIKAIKTREDALERALKLERDTLGYYQGIAAVLGKNDILDAMIQIEQGHVAKLTEYMITGAKMRGLGDNWTGEQRE